MIDEFDEKVIFFSTESLRDYLRDKDREIDFQFLPGIHQPAKKRKP